MLDFSHCNNTPEHADEAIRGATAASGRCSPTATSPPPAQTHTFTSHAMRLEDSRRVQRELQALPGELLTMGISLTEPGLIPFEDTCKEVHTARRLGAVIATHTGCVWALPSELTNSPTAGCWGPTSCTCTATRAPRANWELLRASPEGKISTSPRPSCRWAWAIPRFAPPCRQIDASSLSCDVTSCNSGDM